MPSNGYAAVQTAMKEKLQSLGPALAEFHATEIVNPTKDSAWKKLPMGKRLDAFKFVGETLSKSATKLYWAFISKAQYKDLKIQAEQQRTVGAGHEAGLVFR